MTQHARASLILGELALRGVELSAEDYAFLEYAITAALLEERTDAYKVARQVADECFDRARRSA